MSERELKESSLTLDFTFCRFSWGWELRESVRKVTGRLNLATNICRARLSKIHQGPFKMLRNYRYPMIWFSFPVFSSLFHMQASNSCTVQIIKFGNYTLYLFHSNDHYKIWILYINNLDPYSNHRLPLFDDWNSSKVFWCLLKAKKRLGKCKISGWNVKSFK